MKLYSVIEKAIKQFVYLTGCITAYKSENRYLLVEDNRNL